MGKAMDGLATLDDLDVEDRRVLLRVDLNVPLIGASDGWSVRVADDAHIRSVLPTVEELLRRGARLVLVSHLGHPDGPDPALSMRPVAERLAKLSGASVPLAPAVIGPHVRELTERLAPGRMLMLENVRFEAGETRNDPRLAAALAELADLYVDEAFGCAHRAYASTEGVARLLPGAAGRLMEREILALSAILEEPARPLVAILGGTDARGKISLVKRLVELADAVCLGGAMCLPFLAALGHGDLRGPCSQHNSELAQLALAAPGSGRLELPHDLRLARRGEEGGGTARVLAGVDVAEDWLALDIGPRTADRYAAEIEAAATVFWNGPVGRFELPSFAASTRAIAEAVASTSAATVVAGGRTQAALRAYGLQNRVSHLSTGGRATLRFLEGRELLGVQALRTPVTAR